MCAEVVGDGRRRVGESVVDEAALHCCTHVRRCQARLPMTSGRGLRLSRTLQNSGSPSQPLRFHAPPPPTGPKYRKYEAQRQEHPLSVPR
jgi:hypothetical protein